MDDTIDIQEFADLLKTTVDGARGVLKRNAELLPTVTYGRSRKKYLRRGDAVAFVKRESIR